MFIENFVADANSLFESVTSIVQWDTRMHARLTASFGMPYNYSNMSYPEVEMPTFLQLICNHLQQSLNFLPNNCLINFYQDGSAKMGYHSDSITELIPGTGVAIISLGDTRTLRFREIEDRSIMHDYPLPHGSLLYMPPEVQLKWQHGVPVQENIGPRISLTFRALQV